MSRALVVGVAGVGALGALLWWSMAPMSTSTAGPLPVAAEAPRAPHLAPLPSLGGEARRGAPVAQGRPLSRVAAVAPPAQVARRAEAEAEARVEALERRLARLSALEARVVEVEGRLKGGELHVPDADVQLLAGATDGLSPKEAAKELAIKRGAFNVDLGPPPRPAGLQILEEARIKAAASGQDEGKSGPAGSAVTKQHYDSSQDDEKKKAYNINGIGPSGR